MESACPAISAEQPPRDVGDQPESQILSQYGILTNPAGYPVWLSVIQGSAGDLIATSADHRHHPLIKPLASFPGAG